MGRGGADRAGLRAAAGAALRPRGPGAAGAAVLALAILAAYANALPTTFQFDDWNVVVRDPRVQSLGAWWRSMPGMRALLKLSYAANHASGLGVAGFHAFNVAVHAANACLVLAVLRRLARRLGAPPERAYRAALTGALVFALHPVQTEAVTYVSGRSASLAALFALASVLAWIAGREHERPALCRVVSPALFACGLGVKETAIAVPAALVLWELTGPHAGAGWRRRVLDLAGHAAVCLAAAAAVAASPTYRRLLATSLSLRSPAENLLAQVRAVAYLAGQLVRPDRLNADPLLPVATAWSPRLALAALALLATLAAGVAGLRRRPALAFAILWAAIWLAPTNSLVARLDLANDRQLYLALIGPAWLAGWWLSSRGLSRRAMAAVLATGALLLAGATAWRNGVYATEVRFWEDVVRKTPDNPRALNNLGYAYALACREEDAEAALVIAQDLAPTDARIAVNLGLLRAGALLPPDAARCPDRAGRSD